MAVLRSGTKPVTPAVGDTVLCKVRMAAALCCQPCLKVEPEDQIATQVQKTNPRVANLQVVCVGQRPVQGSFSAIIRYGLGLLPLVHAGSAFSSHCIPLHHAHIALHAAGLRTSEPQRLTRCDHQLGMPVSLHQSQAHQGCHQLQVDLYASFRPGDIVRAAVLALGDSQSYILTTARNDLGVVQAKSLAGAHDRPHMITATPLQQY